MENIAMAAKPRGKAPAPNAGSEPGHLGVDDRGNVTWEWSKNEDLLADTSLGALERVRALVPSSLQIKDEDDDPRNPMRGNAKGLKRGYNPYNSGVLGKRRWQKKKDLKELSRWIDLRKKVVRKKDSE
jgi:hypothetical protein